MVRRQMLADMGITIWRRRQGDSPPEVPAPRVPAANPPTSELRQALQPAPQEIPSGRAVTTPDASAPGVQAPRQKPWSALSLVLDDVVLLVDGECSRRDLRLASDVLAAATGDWRNKAASRRFRWPPELGGGSVADDGARAFNAFVDKDVSDHGARLLLCTPALANRLRDGWTDCRRVEIPSLEDLGREGDAKRALWRSIREPAG